MVTKTMAGHIHWDEYSGSKRRGSPRWASTDRGWLTATHGLLRRFNRDGSPTVNVGNYLDYGPDHYRSSHEYCDPQHPCRDCEPGNVHAVFSLPCGERHWRYFRMVQEAKDWLEHMLDSLIVRLE